MQFSGAFAQAMKSADLDVFCGSGILASVSGDVISAAFEF